MTDEQGVEIIAILRKIDGQLDRLDTGIRAVFDDTQAIRTLLIELGQGPEGLRMGDEHA